jgi:hypothetical protein
MKEFLLMRRHHRTAAAILVVAVVGLSVAPAFGDVLLITDAGTEGIQQYDTVSHTLTTFATQTQIINDLKNQPGAIAAVDAPFSIAKGFDGNIYFSNLGESTIVEYNVTTQHFSQFLDLHNGVSPIFPGYIQFAHDNADGKDHLFVNDFLNSQVLRFNTDGTPAPSAGHTGAIYVSAGQGGLNNPTGVLFSNVGGTAGNVPTLYVNSSNTATPNQINTYTEAANIVTTGPKIGNIQLVNGAKLGIATIGGVPYIFDMNFTNNTGVSVIQYFLNGANAGVQHATYASASLTAPAGFDVSGGVLYIANANASAPSIVTLDPTRVPAIATLVSLNAGSIPIDVLDMGSTAPPPPLASRSSQGDPPAPEPHSLVLLGLGGALLAGCRKFYRKPSV